MLPSPDLSISLAGLSPDPAAPWHGGPRAALDWAALQGFRWLQLDATAPGVRPRELDRSARRDLAAILRRAGLGLSGLDLWIPAAHFTDAARIERALDAALGAIELAGDLSRLMSDPASAVVAMAMPAGAEAAGQLARAAEVRGVRLADHGIPDAEGPRPIPATAPSAIGIGLDPAVLLLRGRDPAREAIAAGTALTQARLSDANETGRVPVGTGRLDTLAYIASLAAASYARPAVLDLRGLADQAHAAQAAASAWPGF